MFNNNRKESSSEQNLGSLRIFRNRWSTEEDDLLLASQLEFTSFIGREWMAEDASFREAQSRVFPAAQLWLHQFITWWVVPLAAMESSGASVEAPAT